KSHSSTTTGHFAATTHPRPIPHRCIQAKVDTDLPLELLGPLGCGIQTGAGAVMLSLGVGAGASIVIVGVGAVGLSAVMAARLCGADPIIAIDLRVGRLDLARE